MSLIVHSPIGIASRNNVTLVELIESNSSMMAVPGTETEKKTIIIKRGRYLLIIRVGMFIVPYTVMSVSIF